MISLSAFAVKMDETTHDVVIRRLELSLEDMDNTDPEKPGIQARLGDLYSDRARLKAMNELSTSCRTCTAAKEDRKLAIATYNKALAKINKEQQGKIIIQIAHLYTMNGDGNKAAQLYKQILNSPRSRYSANIRGLAHANIGEIYFKKTEFKTALNHFEKARSEGVVNRGLIESRIAWCQLNMGENEKAVNTLVKVLKDPDMIATQTTEGRGVDPAFVEEVSRDLARFLARTEVNDQHINLLKDLSPDQARKSNLHILANETNRLGKKQASLKVWAAYLDEGNVSPIERLEVQMRVAQALYDLNKTSQAAKAFEKVGELWKSNGCNGDADLCDEIKTGMRRFVTMWNKAQKTKPSKELFQVYQAYLIAFPQDTEMLHWAAIVGRNLDRHKDAAELFRRASTQAALDLKKDPKNKQTNNIFEGSLLGEIEMAEASKDPKIREAAYNYYLSVNPNGSQATEVRYQRAQVFYSSNRYQDAFNEFHFLAVNGRGQTDLRMKSADLALDCLVAMKDDKALQVRSLEYARIYTERKEEYLKISRKATMNLVAADLKKNENSNDRSAYKASLAALASVDMTGADDAEKIKFFKNKIVLAQKAMDLNLVNDGCNQLLAVRSVSKSDQEWAMAQKVWVAELQLNFNEAYKLSSKMQLSNLSAADRELRLSLLAELAGLDNRKHLETYLKLAGRTRAADLVRVTLIKNSSSPWLELDKHTAALKSSPEVLAGVTLEVFARQRDLRKADKMLNTTRIGKFAAGQTLARQLKIKDFYSFDRKIRSHKIYGYSDAAMQKTLKERLRLISQSDRQAQTNVRSGDWTLQVMSLTQLARENRRLYQDILALPVPSRLNAEQKKQYLAMLKSQSQPYLNRAEKIEAELNQMWTKSNSVQNLQTAYMTASPELQKVYRDEISNLAQIAPSGAKNRLQNLLNTPFRRPSQRDILNARKSLQANPFDISKAQALRELEAQNGRPAMVVYLDERISQLKKGKNL